MLILGINRTIAGAIRPPTVKHAIVRLIPRINIDIEVLKKFLLELKNEIYRS
jgi:hypothetical protein